MNWFRISHGPFRSQMKNISIFTVLFLFLAGTFIVSAQSETRVAATWQVQKYDFQVTLPAAGTSRDVTVRSRIDVKNISGRPANSLTLRMTSSATITAVRIGGSSADFSPAQENVGGARLQRFAMRIAPVAANATVSAEVDYTVKPGDNSGLMAVSPWSTQFLPMSFWYPTPTSWFFPRGADYAPFRVQLTGGSLTTVSAGTNSVGAFEAQAFAQPFFVAGNWERIEAGGVEVFSPTTGTAAAKERASEIAAIVEEARQFMSTLLGPVPNMPLRVVGVRRGAGFASGGTILVDEGVFRRSKLDSITVTQIAEAVAKNWIGDTATVTDDGSGVVREGLSRHIATKFLASKYGADVANVERMRHRTAYAAVSRRDAPLRSVAPIDDYYFSAVANKGSMFWRLLERRLGSTEFYSRIQKQLATGTLTLPELRLAFGGEKALVDYMLDDVTDINLQVGLPQISAGEAKVALRNTGGFDVNVNVVATLSNGQKLTTPAAIRAQSFGEVIFKAPQTITRIEIDPEKLYPQVDYSDDIAPRQTTDSDLLLAVKRDFDSQRYAAAEKTAIEVLRDYPRFDDVMVLLARSQLAQNKITEAERGFRAVLNEPLPSARSLAWANVGMADISVRTGRTADAARYANEAILIDGEYGASLAARVIRNRQSSSTAVDSGIKEYFAQFDRAAVSNRRADLEALAMPGEADRFIGGISGQATNWTTSVLHADMLDENSALVETTLSVRLLTREPESGTAVFRLIRTAAGWRLAGVEIFEVR